MPEGENCLPMVMRHFQRSPEQSTPAVGGKRQMPKQPTVITDTSAPLQHLLERGMDVQGKLVALGDDPSKAIARNIADQARTARMLMQLAQLEGAAAKQGGKTLVPELISMAGNTGAELQQMGE